MYILMESLLFSPSLLKGGHDSWAVMVGFQTYKMQLEAEMGAILGSEL